MGTLARSRDDLIIDGLVAKTKKHRDADVLVDAGYNYTVERDKTSPWQGLKTPFVNFEQESDDGKNKDYVAKYHATCLVPVIGEDDDVAVARLYILKEQVKKSLLDRDDFDIGQPAGSIGKMSEPAWRRVKFDDEKLNEGILVGEWSFEIPYPYVPLEITGTPLVEVSVAMTEKFSTLYPFGSGD